MPIFKNTTNDDTCLSDTKIEGWAEITQEELTAILESRRVQPDAQLIREQKLAKVRADREVYLGRILGVKDAARDSGDSATVEACKVARQSLLEIMTDLSQDPAEIDGAVSQRYETIRAGCTPEMVKVFARVEL